MPTRTQAYNKNYERTRIQKSDDPVKSLISKQTVDDVTGKGIIPKIIFDDESFIVVLFTDRMINNIDIFCRNNTDQFLSSFCMDFTFEIGYFFYLFLLSKTAPYYPRKVLVGSFPVMLCQKRTEKAVKVFFDAVLEQLPGLNLYMKANGADGEKSLIVTFNLTCDSFPTAMVLLCMLHAKKNIKRKLVERLKMNKEESKHILEDLFVSSFQTGLIEIDQPDQFERCAQPLIDNWKYGSKKTSHVCRIF